MPSLTSGRCRGGATSTLFRGRFWGGRTAAGPVTRLEMDVGKGGFTHRILVQGGPDGAIWTSDGAVAGVLNEDAALAPLVPGVEMAPFDILPMPYLYWLDSEPRGRGADPRPAGLYLHALLPADFSARHPAVRSVRACSPNTQYDAPVQSEISGYTTMSLRPFPRWS